MVAAKTKNNKVNFSQLEVGQYLSETQYYKIISIDKNSIEVENARGLTFDIDSEIVEEGMWSASQYKTEKQVSRTEICEYLAKAGNNIFTINFDKQVKAQDCSEKIKQLLANSDSYKTKKRLDEFAKDLLTGENRTLVGYLINSEPMTGRSTVIDLEVSSDRHRLRQVDHRSIQWMILKNVKYIVK